MEGNRTLVERGCDTSNHAAADPNHAVENGLVEGAAQIALAKVRMHSEKVNIALIWNCLGNESVAASIRFLRNFETE